MRRHGHDRSRAVSHQDVVGHPDRDRLAVDGVDGEPSREDAVLLLLLSLDLGARGSPADVVEHLLLVLRAGDEPRHQLVLGRQDEERCPEQRVRTRGEDGKLLPASLDAEDDARPVGPPDPVALHRQHTLRPVLEQVHLVEQLVRVVRDPEEPLGQALRLDLGAAALATAVDDLLVREDGLVVRAPLDGCLLAIGETALVEAEEQPLRPPVVGRVVRRDLPAPVDRPAHPVHLLADRDDVALGDGSRMPALLDRGVLGGQAEGVVSHRPQHLHALAPAQMRDHVADRVVQRVPHVEIARTGRAASRPRTTCCDRRTSPSGRGSGRGTTARRPRPSATSPRSTAGRSVPSSPSLVRPGIQKSLSRERLRGDRRGRRRTLSLRHVRSRTIASIVPPAPARDHRCRDP